MNAAIAAARLGVPTAFVGRVSTDENGDLIWAHLEESGVVLSAAQRGPEPTARAVVVTKPVQSFTFEGDNTADASMVEADISSLGPGPHILHAGTLGIFRGTTAEALAGLLDGFDGVVSFDPNIRPQVDSFCGATLVRLHQAGCMTPEAVAALDAETWRSIVDYGVRAAAITVSRLGADPPWANELSQ